MLIQTIQIEDKTYAYSINPETNEPVVIDTVED